MLQSRFFILAVLLFKSANSASWNAGLMVTKIQCKHKGHRMKCTSTEYPSMPLVFALNFRNHVSHSFYISTPCTECTELEQEVLFLW